MARLIKFGTFVMRGLSRVSCAASVWPFTRYMHLRVHAVPSETLSPPATRLLCPRVSQDAARGPRAHDARQTRASQMGLAREDLRKPIPLTRLLYGNKK